MFYIIKRVASVGQMGHMLANAGRTVASTARRSPMQKFDKG